MREDAPKLVGEVASLIRERNFIDERIARIINRPALAGHLGEWIASQVFDVDLEAVAVSKAIDGRFTTGPLTGRTVNVKWYGKRENLLDLTAPHLPDYYLVFAGPKTTAPSSLGGTRPLQIDACYLFNARTLVARQIKRGAKVGVASSVPSAEWEAAEIYPRPNNPVLEVSPTQAELLELFSGKPHP